MGDARLSLEREPDEHFDVLAVDAFSSDSIPVHLLTREAMAALFPPPPAGRHSGGAYLQPVPGSYSRCWKARAKALGKVARVVDTEDDESQDVFGATWVLITNPATGFDAEEIQRSAEIESKRKVRLWTDDYSNLFQILK